jgi:hypothetical protein
MELKQIEKAIKESWDIKTCHPDWARKWSKKNLSEGQCGVSVLIIQDYLGGKIAFNKKLHHVWNILPDGSEYDITRNQFPKGTKIERDGFISRHDMFYNDLAKKAKVKERYKLLKKRVDDKLGL